MVKNPLNNDIIIVGDFFNVNKSSGTLNTKFIAKYNTTNGFSNVGLPTDLNNQTHALAIDSQGIIYVGGLFTSVRGESISYIAKYDINDTINGKWSSLRTNTISEPAIPDQVNWIAINSSNHVYFTSNGVIYKYASNNLSVFAVTTGYTTTPDSGYISCIAFKNTHMYVSGVFTSIGESSSNNIPANNIAKYNLETGVWSNLASGLGWSATMADNIREVSSIKVDLSENIYISGNFNSVNGFTTSSVAVYKNNNWERLGENGVGLNGPAYSIDIDSTGTVYFAGAFTASGTTQINRIAKYNSTTDRFSALSTPYSQNKDIYSIFIDPNNKLYICGNIPELYHFARYNE
jgi:hypothetical protein